MMKISKNISLISLILKKKLANPEKNVLHLLAIANLQQWALNGVSMRNHFFFLGGGVRLG